MPVKRKKARSAKWSQCIPYNCHSQPKRWCWQNYYISQFNSLAACGLRVLLVDFDPQGNASTGLALIFRTRCEQLWLVTGEVSGDTINSLSTGLDIIAAGWAFGRGSRINGSWSSWVSPRWSVGGVTEEYDHILIDCPPSLGLASKCALCCKHCLCRCNVEFARVCPANANHRDCSRRT